MSAWFDARFFGEVFVTLLVIMDPPGSVPVFLSLTGSYTRKARNRSADLAVLDGVDGHRRLRAVRSAGAAIPARHAAALAGLPADCCCSSSRSNF